jgi:hypothetical protein
MAACFPDRCRSGEQAPFLLRNPGCVRRKVLSGASRSHGADDMPGLRKSGRPAVSENFHNSITIQL